MSAFFDIVTYLLEKGERGKNFPVLKSLYDGERIVAIHGFI